MLIETKAVVLWLCFSAAPGWSSVVFFAVLVMISVESVRVDSIPIDCGPLRATVALAANIFVPISSGGQLVQVVSSAWSLPPSSLRSFAVSFRDSHTPDPLRANPAGAMAEFGDNFDAPRIPLPAPRHCCLHFLSAISEFLRPLRSPAKGCVSPGFSAVGGCVRPEGRRRIA
jgi:hypothetical protein